jgi:hypothetical protein
VNAGVLTCVVFGLVFGGAMLGAWLRMLLPAHHLSAESKDIVRLGTGLVATMTALILGLLVASAKSSYDTDKSEVVQMAAKIVFLDRVLANYGPETQDARDTLRRAVNTWIARMWPDEKTQHADLDPTASPGEELHRMILQLAPKDDVQLSLKAQAVSVAADLGQMRWLLFEQTGTSISMPFLAVVVLWLAIIFMSFGLFAPFNTTVLATLLVCALSVSCALLLILELDQPFDGVIHISSAPMHNALEHLGR